MLPYFLAVSLFFLALLPVIAQQPPVQQPAPPQTSTEPAPPPFPPAGQVLTPDQLDGLVAPIALYPDPLVTQVLVASTYPREVTLAVQFMNQHPDLKGKDLADAAREQNWDPSIQALVMFPGVLRRLNQDKQWTTNLGNAFLAQQADVMQAVQRMRRAAKAAGKLSNTRQMRVIETSDSDQTVIEIVPAQPDVLFVPAYNPAWIWGPPLWYPYPRWIWGPAPVAPGVWFGFGPAIAVGAYIGPGWAGWGGWGWRPGWVNNTVVVNNTFVNRSVNVTNTMNVTNTNITNNRNVSQTSVWTHDPVHRQGVPYANSQVAQRFHAPPPGAQAAQPRAQNAGRGAGAGGQNAGRGAGGGRANAAAGRGRVGGGPHPAAKAAPQGKR